MAQLITSVTAPTDSVTGVAPTILAATGVLPAYGYPQQQLTQAFAEFVGLDGPRRKLLERVHGNAGVRSRRLAVPIERYARMADFGAANDAFIEAGCDLAQQAVQQALAAAGLRPDQVDVIVAATSTGMSVPSLDARIAIELGLRQDVVRLPLIGLGCAAGAGGVARLADLVLGRPGRIGVLLTVELCSLTLQRGDMSTANLIASGLFGDGAAAVVMTGGDGGSDGVPGQPRVVATRSRLYPHTERAMGWDVSSAGLQIVLGAEIPELVRSQLPADVDGFLADRGLSRDDIGWWVCHPGGPKVLQAVEESLNLTSGELGLTWDSLARIGNISSSSVLHVLEDTLRERPPEPGSYGLMLAMGPGFALELVLLQA
ncbi:MAG: type III polyketide synthase [Microlunatus sp.]|nr:type III polyketide synthase [Microlunatus sp.]